MEVKKINVQVDEFERVQAKIKKHMEMRNDEILKS